MVYNSGNDASRADPARGPRRFPPAPGNPRQARSETPCSGGESPPIPAQSASGKTGLSRRRSRVRVPSLPLKTSCKLACFVAKMGVNDRRLFACAAEIPHDVEKALFAGNFTTIDPAAAGSIPREIRLGRDNRALRSSERPRLGARRWAVGQSATPGRPSLSAWRSASSRSAGAARPSVIIANRIRPTESSDGPSRPSTLEDLTREELYARAQEADIPGRSRCRNDNSSTPFEQKARRTRRPRAVAVRTPSRTHRDRP